MTRSSTVKSRINDSKLDPTFFRDDSRLDSELASGVWKVNYGTLLEKLKNLARRLYKENTVSKISKYVSRMPPDIPQTAPTTMG